MKKERRWLKSVIAASLQPQPALPWQRGARRKPVALKTPVATPAPRAIAAH
ncbi:hypothetical protein [Pseudotabrizicola sp. L79]|uniref:hypothetical protein n=1 Tax=Pseudotabrizicola sp. L79 TaxID=3118402 RepID=UPI002F95B943